MTVTASERIGLVSPVSGPPVIHLEEFDRLPWTTAGTLPASASLSGADLWLVTSEGAASPGADRGQWLESALVDLRRWLNEPPNWDGYGAKPISTRAAQRAELALRVFAKTVRHRPFVTGTTDGGVNLQWDSNSYDLQVICLDKTINVYVCDKDSDEQWEGPLESAATAIQTFMDRSFD